MNKKEQLRSLIQKQSFLNEEEKNGFLDLIERISDDEVNLLIQFFQESDEKLEQIHKNYKNKEQDIYKKYIHKIHKDTLDEKKLLMKFFESKSNKTETKQGNQLIQSLKNF